MIVGTNQSGRLLICWRKHLSSGLRPDFNRIARHFLDRSSVLIWADSLMQELQHPKGVFYHGVIFHFLFFASNHPLTISTPSTYRSLVASRNLQGQGYVMIKAAVTICIDLPLGDGILSNVINP